MCGAAGDGLLHRPRPTGHEPEEPVRSTTLMPKTRKDEDRDRPQPSRLLAMTIISSPKIHPTSQRREEGPGGRGDHATGSWARASRPSQPRREARGRGVRNTHTAHRSPACSLRPTDPGAATPRPTSSPGPQRSGVAGRSAAGPETSPGRGHAYRAEGGGGGAIACSDGVLEFRSRGLFHFYTNIATFSYFSGEANGPAAPPLPSHTHRWGHLRVVHAGVSLCPLPRRPVPRRLGSRCEFGSK